jgi:hypothetical protein
MTDPLSDQYPGAAPYIWVGIKEHGEGWVIEHYHPKIVQLGLVMDVPDIEELPFYDPDGHETMTAVEQRDYYEALGEYRENPRTGTRPGQE